MLEQTEPLIFTASPVQSAQAVMPREPRLSPRFEIFGRMIDTFAMKMHSGGRFLSSIAR